MKLKREHPVIWLIILIVFGGFGVHKFIEGKPKLGILYFFTMGLFGVGWIYDIAKQIIYIIRIKNIENGIAKSINSSLQAELAKVDSMTVDGWAFERYTVDLLLKNGFDNAETTSGSNDYGVDVIAEKDGIKYAVQCKCYSNKLNNKPVQEVLAGMAYYNAHVGVVFTNNYFTENAKQLAKANNVLLWDRTKLIEFIKPFCDADSNHVNEISQIEAYIVKQSNSIVDFYDSKNIPITIEKIRIVEDENEKKTVYSIRLENEDDTTKIQQSIVELSKFLNALFVHTDYPITFPYFSIEIPYTPEKRY